MPKTLSKPEWLVVRSASEQRLNSTRSLVERHGLHTVCRSAQCPNIFDCWHRGELTVLILGDVCTRACRFCATTYGDPEGKLDAGEPQRVADFVRETETDYLIITSVARDDLPDGGAAVFAGVIEKVRKARNRVKIEVLVPDFSGSPDSLKKVAAARPDVLGHNIETVQRLSQAVRDRRANYQTSLFVLKTVKELNPGLVTKSGFMLGLGERKEEVIRAMADLKASEVDFLTIGQYLQPSAGQLPVARYVSQEEFDDLRKTGLEMGFRSVAAGPFVRSSYRAAEAFTQTSTNE